MKFRLLKEDHTRTYTAKHVAKLRRAQRRYKGFAAAMLILAAFHAKAQDNAFSASLISAPTAIQAPVKVKHNFNVYDYGLYAGVVGYRVADYMTTEKLMGVGGHEVELPKGLIANKPAFLAYSLGMAGLQIEGSMLLHKHGHAKIARVVDALSISAGFATDGRNVNQIYKQEGINAHNALYKQEQPLWHHTMVK